MIGPDAIDRDVRLVLASGEEWFATPIQILADKIRASVFGGHGAVYTFPTDAIVEAELVDLPRARIVAIAQKQHARLMSKRPVFVAKKEKSAR